MSLNHLKSFGSAAFILISVFSLSLAGCGGGGGGLSSQTVSGVAAAGSALSGQISLKDASTTPQIKTTVIGSDGSYAIDVSGMKAPFIVEATGSASGTDYTLHSFADGPGTANVNPLTNVAVANAAGVNDPSQVFGHPDMATLQKISSQFHASVSTLLAKLQPLLLQFGALNQDPINGNYTVNHTGLDGLFDHVKFVLANGALTVIDATTNASIFSGMVTNMANWNTIGTLPVTPPAPTVPTGLAATGGTGQITLTWASTGNATSYNVYYGTSPGVTTTSGMKIAIVSSPYVHTGLPAATSFYYIVTAVNSAGESAPSIEASASTASAPPVPTVPGAPTGVSAIGGTKQATISWSAVSGAASYTIYWSTNPGVTTANGTKITGAISPAVQIGLSDNTTYYYIVTAVNGVGESAPSVQVAATTLTLTPQPTAPSAPTGLSAAGGTNQVTLSWLTVTGATSYNVYYSTTLGAGIGGTKIAGVTSPYIQTGLSAGTTYYYVVTAQNGVGESGASSQASAATNTPPPVLPAAPTGVTTSGGANQVTVSWSAVSGATSYNIYWSTTSGKGISGTKISGATSPYLQSGLAASTAYYYVVTAVNSAGEGASSSQATATTTAAPPAFDALTFYNTSCLGCHGTLGPRTAAQITSAIASVGSMSKYRSTGSNPLTAAQISAIAAVSH
jgi:fibronectin type 3 domain-containing protein